MFGGTAFGRGTGFGIHKNASGVACFVGIGIGRRANVLGSHSDGFFSCGGGVSCVGCTFRGGISFRVSGASALSLRLGMRLGGVRNPLAASRKTNMSGVFKTVVKAGPISFPMVCPRRSRG